MKRSIILILLLIASALISSCGLIVIHLPGEETAAVTESDTETAAETEPEKDYKKITRDKGVRAKKYLETVEDADWNGAVVKISSVYPALSDTEDSPQIIASAVEERNRLVSEKLGVQITTEATDTAALFAELSVNMKAGMYSSDILVIPQNSAASFAASGLIFNLRSLPSFDLDAPYFNESAVDALSAGYECFAVAGEMTYMPNSFWGLFFAKERFERIGLTSPYALVRSGNWTLDEYFALAAEAGSYAPIVTGSHGDEAADAFYFGLGGTMMSSGVRRNPAVTVDAEAIDRTAELLRSVFTANGARTGEDGGAEVFEKSALFMCDRLDAMNYLSTVKTGWGLVPLPKASADQEDYVTLASGDSPVMAAPSILFSDRRTSQVIRSLAAASAGRIPQAFVDYSQYSLLRDNDSTLMLDTILGNVVYDFAYTAGTMYPNAASATYLALRGAVFSGESASAAVAYYAPICEKELAAAFPMS